MTESTAPKQNLVFPDEARDFRDRAMSALAVLPRDDARSSLEDIADYVVERRS